MNSQRIFTKTFFLGALSLFALTFVPGFASSEPATAQQSPFRALDSPRLQATSGELNRQLMPSPIPLVPSHPERSESPTHTRLAELTEDDGASTAFCAGGLNETICADSPELGDSEFGIRLRSGVLEPGEGLDIDGIVGAATDERVHFLIQADALPLDFDDLQEFGIDVLEFVGGRAFLAAAFTDDLSGLQGLPGVRWAGPLNAVFKLAPELQGGDPETLVPWAITVDGEVGINATYHGDIPDQDAIFAAESAGRHCSRSECTAVVSGRDDDPYCGRT